MWRVLNLFVVHYIGILMILNGTLLRKKYYITQIHTNIILDYQKNTIVSFLGHLKFSFNLKQE